MPKKNKPSYFSDINEQAARSLLSSIFEFLESNQISRQMISEMIEQYASKAPTSVNQAAYKQLVAAYDDMGAILSTWFSKPEFLDSKGQPITLSYRKTPDTFTRLLKVSSAQVTKKLALELMRQSPSFAVGNDGRLSALRRVFILTDFRIPRAAFNIERYLDTVKKSGSTRKTGAVALLERSSYVSRIDLAKVAPFLRSIEDRGTAFMDSIDGEVEGRRLRRLQSRNVGELGVSIFAWTKQSSKKAKIKKPKNAI